MSDSTTEEPAATETYTGSCHCKRISYTVKAPPIYDNDVVTCNCSHCEIKAPLFIYRPNEHVTFQSGEGECSTYRFNTKTIEHCFCPTCGTTLYGESFNPAWFPGWKGINVRTLHGIDLSKLKLKHFDNKDKDKDTTEVSK